MYCATYSSKRDEDSKKNENLTDNIICDQFSIDISKLINKDGTEDDFRGIDRILPNGETIQKKNCECCQFDTRYSDTITIPCKNYEEYKQENIDWIFHSYYNKNEEDKVRQWVLIKFDELVIYFDPKRKRRNPKTGTYFYYWPYNHGYIRNQGVEICILDHAKSYSIP